MDRAPGAPALAALRSENPYLDFARAIELFYTPPRYAPGIHPTAVIAKSARVGEGAHIGPYCFVDEGVEIGRNAVLHSSVTVYRGVKIGDDFFAHAHAVVREFCSIGNRVLLQNGVIIGCDGLGFAKLKRRQLVQDGAIRPSGTGRRRGGAGQLLRGPRHRGRNAHRRGSKLDDMVLVGHASKIGRNAMLCGQVGLAGSTQIGNGCILAGQVGSSGHLTLGDNSVITAKSGIPRDVPAGAMHSGIPGGGKPPVAQVDCGVYTACRNCKSACGNWNLKSKSRRRESRSNSLPLASPWKTKRLLIRWQRCRQGVVHQFIQSVAIFQRKSRRIDRRQELHQNFARMKNQRPLLHQTCAFEHATGTMGAPALMAMTTAPFLNFCRRPLLLRVPSG